MPVKVKNADRLQRKLKAIPDFAQAEIRKAMEKSAAEIVKFARSLVPVDSGDLRDSIGWTWGDAPARSIGLATAQSGDMVLTVFAGDDDAYYARWVEFGTQKMPGQAFFFPAYRLTKKRVRGRINRAMNKAVRQAVARS